MVIVDTQIVAGAPARLLAAGIGDALATWFEARACSRSGATTMAGGKCTQAALALAELCYNTLIEEGEKAMLAAEPARRHACAGTRHRSQHLPERGRF